MKKLTAKEQAIVRRVLPHAFETGASHLGLKQYSLEYLHHFRDDLRSALLDTTGDIRWWASDEHYDQEKWLASVKQQRSLAGRLAAVVRQIRRRE